MTKSQIIKALQDVPDDTEIMVDVIIYSEVCPDVVQQKRFNTLSVDVWDKVPVILVQCPDSEVWECSE